jgi:TonB family protein
LSTFKKGEPLEDKFWARAVAILATALVLQSSVAWASGKGKKEQAKELFQTAYAASEIEAEGSPAFHLKAQFTFYGADFQLTNGSYDELWMSSGRRRTLFSVPYGSDAIGIANGQRWQKSSLPYTTYLESLVNLAIGFDSTLKSGPPKKIKRIQNEASGTGYVTCIVPDKDYGVVSCFDLHSGRLDQQNYPEWNADYHFSNYEPWGGKWFPRKIEIDQEGSPLVRITVEEIAALGQLSPSAFDPLPGAEVGKIVTCPQYGSPAILVKSVPPEYPPDALRKGKTATVDFYADIGKQGQIRGLEVVRSASAEFDTAAIKSVNQWRYKPPVCNGVPFEVVMFIAVHFEIGLR